MNFEPLKTIMAKFWYSVLILLSFWIEFLNEKNYTKNAPTKERFYWVHWHRRKSLLLSASEYDVKEIDSCVGMCIRVFACVCIHLTLYAVSSASNSTHMYLCICYIWLSFSPTKRNESGLFEFIWSVQSTV